MFVTNHVLAGAAIGRLVRKPVPSFLIGVVSHFAMDAVPHWNAEGDKDVFYRAARVDGLLGLAAIGAVAGVSHPDQRTAVLAGVAGAVLPDITHPYEKIVGRQLWPARVNEFHHRIQRGGPRYVRHEVVVGLAGAAAVMALLRRGARR